MQNVAESRAQRPQPGNSCKMTSLLGYKGVGLLIGAHSAGRCICNGTALGPYCHCHNCLGAAALSLQNCTEHLGRSPTKLGLCNSSTTTAGLPGMPGPQWGPVTTWRATGPGVQLGCSWGRWLREHHYRTQREGQVLVTKAAFWAHGC